MTFSVANLLRGFGAGASVTPPTAPSIAVADNGDGTGGVVTVSGGDAGALHTAYCQQVDGELGTGTWTAAGSRTGNGTIAVAPTADRYYWWHVVATSAGGSRASNLVYQNITSGTNAIHYRCLLAIQSRILGLTLTGVENASVRIQKLPWAANFGSGHEYSYPAIIISPVGSEQAQPTAGTNYRDEYGYPCTVAIAATDNQDLVTNHDRYLLWREKIARAFQNQRLPGVSESKATFVEPASIVDPEKFSKQFFHSMLTVRCVCLATRGLT